MTPIETIFLLLGAFITLIGLARGYAKELGSTLIILVAIFLLSFFEGYIEDVLNIVGDQAFSLGAGETSIRNLLLGFAFQSIFVMIVFAGYAGRTFDFPGALAPAPQGPLLSLALGLLNGYLIAGTLWYYLDKYEYPYLTLVQGLTERAQALIQFLPQNIFQSPVYWMFPVAILLLMRVRG